MPLRIACLALLLLVPFAAVRAEDSDYKLGPDSMVKPDVPQGKVTEMPPWTSKIFEGTVRDWWIYVPAQYDAAKPASLMVFQDGGGYVNLKGDFRVPTVFDNLIAAKEMPVTIAVFINPGVVPPAEGNKDAKPRQNRSFEYDTLSDQYVRFLEKEILPEVENLYKISKEPKDRAICGISSGGICAFTAAWERPDLFSKVLSQVGSFTNIRGGSVGVRQIRLQIRVRHRPPQRQTRRRHPARLAALAVARAKGMTPLQGSLTDYGSL
jgi:enterochelin esterase-like enzyme